MLYKNKSLKTHKKSTLSVSTEDISLAQSLAQKIKTAKDSLTLTVGEEGVFAIKQIPYAIGSIINLYTIHVQPQLIPVISVKANAIDLFLPSCKIRIIVKKN